MTVYFRTMAAMLTVVACMSAPVGATVLPFDLVYDADGYEIAGYDEMPQGYGDRADKELGYDGDYEEGNGWTPKVEVDYAASTTTVGEDELGYLGWWGGVTYRLGDADNHGSWTYTFTPDAGWGVKVNSFDFDEYNKWPDPDVDEVVTWNLWGNEVGGVLLASEESLTVPFGTIVPVATGAGAHFGPVILEFIHLSGDVDGDIGIDNLNFDQVEAGAGIPGDFDNDNDVDGADFLKWQRTGEGSLSDWQTHFGEPFALAIAAVPEPATLVLFGLGLCGLLGIRGRK